MLLIILGQRFFHTVSKVYGRIPKSLTLSLDWKNYLAAQSKRLPFVGLVRAFSNSRFCAAGNELSDNLCVYKADRLPYVSRFSKSVWFETQLDTSSLGSDAQPFGLCADIFITRIPFYVRSK